MREDQKVRRQMLRANRSAADWAKATRHPKALNMRSDRSNCSNGVTFTSTEGLRLPRCLAEFTGTPIHHLPLLHTLNKSIIYHIWSKSSICLNFFFLIHNQNRLQYLNDFHMFTLARHASIWFFLQLWDDKNRPEIQVWPLTHFLSISTCNMILFLTIMNSWHVWNMC